MYTAGRLQPGDIVLVAGTRLIDSLVRWVTAAPFSHALLVADGCLIEANWSGVRTRALADFAGSGWVFAVAGATGEQRRRAVDAARSRLGQPYGYAALARDAAREVLHVPFFTRLNPRRLTCSGLVVWSWRQAGIRLTWAPLPSPYDLACSPLLVGPRPWTNFAG